jgi:hypothetical protein
VGKCQSEKNKNKITGFSLVPATSDDDKNWVTVKEPMDLEEFFTLAFRRAWGHLQSLQELLWRIDRRTV